MPYAGHFLVPCLVPQFQQLNFFLGGLFSSLSEGVFLSVDLSFSRPVPCTDESLSSSFICISVAYADRSTSSAFSSVRSDTLSNLSLAFVLFTPSTIRSLTRDFFNVPNSHVSQSFLNIVTYWSTLLPLSWALEKNFYLSYLTFFFGSQCSSNFNGTFSIFYVIALFVPG